MENEQTAPMLLSSLKNDLKKIIGEYDIESSFIVGSSYKKDISTDKIVDMDIVIIFKNLNVKDLEKAHEDFKSLCKKHSNGVKVIYKIIRGPIKPKYAGKKIIQLHLTISESLEAYKKRDPLFLYNHIKFNYHLAGKKISDLVKLPEISISDLLYGKRSIRFHIEKIKEEKRFNKVSKIINNKIQWIPITEKYTKEGFLDFVVSIVFHLTRNFLQITKNINDPLENDKYSPELSQDFQYFVKLKKELKGGNYDLDKEEVKQKGLDYLKKLEEISKELNSKEK